MHRSARQLHPANPLGSEEAHIKGFRTSPQFKPFFAAVQPFIKDIAEMRHYELTALQWAR
jgi:hypothetical protein